MAPKRKPPARAAAKLDPDGMFRGVSAFVVPHAVQSRRLEVWKQRLAQMGGRVQEKLAAKGGGGAVTHVLAADAKALLRELDAAWLHRFRGSVVSFEWLEECLKSGERLPEHKFAINYEEEFKPKKEGGAAGSGVLQSAKRSKISSDGPENRKETAGGNRESRDAIAHPNEDSDVVKGPSTCTSSQSASGDSKETIASQNAFKAEEASSGESSTYAPPDLNRNITEIFGKLINIYRALGDDRRSFSYYKAIPVIEKLPFKIESADQVKDLPAIGKSLKDHINEIVNTGKLSKLEHFENDEKVRTVSLFGEVWGVGPATALKLYDKGHRTLDDLQKDDSLTSAQRIGLKFFDDIKQRIPRHEVSEMEKLLQEVGTDILPGVIIVCGGSYRRGKSSCGDMDIIITHPDGESHVGFLPKFVQRLKDINFLREDLIFSIHSIEGTDCGVDTYFGLCTYPGRELRHRIDLKKVYPRNRHAFGLLAWTGNDVLNRRLRILADSKGYILDDTGLYLATPGSGGKRGGRSDAIINCDTEKDVFDTLGFPWLEPHERNL
ncbi:DNA polymerase lambda isoform X1 [Oryza glaberrima]|uniref:DNA polymerase n=1 Tax=Oryza glaberrima TaxID=4538 RepID=I1Q121_ORYGL|nr:DNA polymerase lambda isoform X1 [Oryza glaberrima]